MLTGWSDSCHSNRLQSAHSSPPACTVTPFKPTDLSRVPVEYHDLAEAFIEECALSASSVTAVLTSFLGVLLSSSRLYHLSRPEQEAIERYVTDSLVAGLIHSSSSLFGARFFFVQKDGSLRPRIDYWGLNEIIIKNNYPLNLPILFSVHSTGLGSSPSPTLEMFTILSGSIRGIN